MTDQDEAVNAQGTDDDASAGGAGRAGRKGRDGAHAGGAPRRRRRTREHEPEAEEEEQGDKVTGWKGIFLPFLRWAAPVLAVLLYLMLASDEILVDAGWLPFFACVLLAPAFALERRKRDGIALALLLVGAVAGAGLTGPPAAGAAVGALALSTLISAPFLFFSALAEGLS